MWVVTIIAVSCLFVGTSLAGVKDLGSHFRFYDQSPTPNTEPDPRGLSQGGALDMENIPLEFHKENTVTNDLPMEGFEDEDYIDFDKILAEGGDDYRWVIHTLLTL